MLRPKVLARLKEIRGDKEAKQVIKKALYEVLGDEAEVERIFLVIKSQREY